MGFGGKSEADHYEFAWIGGEGGGVMPFLNLRHGVFGRAVYLELDYVDVVGGLDKHVDETFRSAVFCLDIKTHQSG